MTSSTAVVKQDTTHLVVEGAGLDASVWLPARVAALNKLLPAKFQGSTENLIALASLVDRTGLDPFIKELYCWEDKGRVTYHVGRDGWLKIAKRDPDIASVASGVIFENDTFAYERDEEGFIHIQHKGGFPQGMLVGAWAVVTPEDGPDQLVTRELSYYKHLLGKDNWRNYPAEMLETRVLATAIKFVSSLAAGLYAPGEAADDEYTPTVVPGVQATQERSSELAATLKAIPDPEYEVVEDGDAGVFLDPSDVVVTVPEPRHSDIVEIPPSDPPMLYDCEFCGAQYDTPQGYSSHSRTHKAEKALVESWQKDGFLAEHGPDGWSLSNEQTGEIVAQAAHFEDLVEQFEEPVEPADEIATATATEVYKAMTEAGPDCDKDWLDAVLQQYYPERRKDGADRVGLFDLTEEDRAEVVERIRDTFGS